MPLLYTHTQFPNRLIDLSIKLGFGLASELAPGSKTICTARRELENEAFAGPQRGSSCSSQVMPDALLDCLHRPDGATYLCTEQLLSCCCPSTRHYILNANSNGDIWVYGLQTYMESMTYRRSPVPLVQPIPVPALLRTTVHASEQQA